MRYWLLIVGLIASLGACAQDSDAPASAAPAAFVEGKHYLPLSAAVPTIVGDKKVEITEIFRFSCPACFRFEQASVEWKKTKSPLAELVKNPVVWNDDTEIRAQVYYAGAQLGLEQETAMAIFKSIHEATSQSAAKNALLKEDDILTMFESLGVERAKAKKMYNNWFIKSKVRQADGRARDFAINGTPELFVDGRYRITVSSAGSYEAMLQVADFLVAKIAAERGLN